MVFLGLSEFSDFLAFAAVFSSILIGFYCRQLNSQRISRSGFDKKAVLVITAHPDDECMFLSPAILILKRCSTVQLLCLSTGNYYKHGEVRQKELVSSCGILGIPSNYVTVVDHSSLPDDPTVDWDNKLVGKMIANHVKENKIQVVITFDSYGVSGHTNHIAVYKAVKRLKDEGLLENVAAFVCFKSSGARASSEGHVCSQEPVGVVQEAIHTVLKVHVDQHT